MSPKGRKTSTHALSNIQYRKKLGSFKSKRVYESNLCLNLNCGGHILLVNSPDSRKINGLVPSIQNGNHLAYAPEIAFEDRLEVVTTTAGLFYDDSELIVDEETHEKEARTNQVVLKYLQSTAHLGILQGPAITSTPIG